MLSFYFYEGMVYASPLLFLLRRVCHETFGCPALLLLVALPCSAQIKSRLAAHAVAPAGYYQTVEGRRGPELRLALHLILTNASIVPYSARAWTPPTR